MVLKLNPSRPLLWRTPTDAQLGTATDAVKLTSLTRNQERLLQMLYKGIPSHLYKQVAEDTCTDEAEQFLDAIRPALLESTNFPDEYVANQFAEICRAQATYNHSGSAVLANRKQARVYLGQDPGQLISNALSIAGVGEISSHDAGDFDFAILTAQQAIMPSSFATWLRNQTPHIALIFDFEGVLISPVIEAGKTPCLNCFQENLTAQDSAWPLIASQLLFSEQKLDDQTSRLFAAAMVTNRALGLIDELGKFEVADRNRNGYRLDIASGTIRELRWEFSSTCLCKQA